MTNAELIEKLKKMKDSRLFVCDNNRKHKSLVPVEEGNKVVLRCPDCNYVCRTLPVVKD